MKMDFAANNSRMVVSLDGRLDSVTAPDLEKEIGARLDGITELTFDFSRLRYVSSAGLRVILSCSKKMKAAQGTLTIENPNEMVMDIFDATGFVDILDIRRK